MHIYIFFLSLKIFSTKIIAFQVTVLLVSRCSTFRPFGSKYLQNRSKSPQSCIHRTEILYPKFAYSPLPQNIKISGHPRKAYLFGPNNDKAKNLTIFERDMQKVTWVKTPQNRTSAIKAIKDNHISIKIK